MPSTSAPGPFGPNSKGSPGQLGQGIQSGGEAKNLGFPKMNKENMQLLSAWEDKEDGIG